MLTEQADQRFNDAVQHDALPKCPRGRALAFTPRAAALQLNLTPNPAPAQTASPVAARQSEAKLPGTAAHLELAERQPLRPVPTAHSDTESAPPAPVTHLPRMAAHVQDQLLNCIDLLLDAVFLVDADGRVKYVDALPANASSATRQTS